MDYTSIKVGQLPTAEISGSDYFPHEVAGLLKKATITDLAAFIGATDAIGFRAVSVPNGGTLPTTDTQEFILVGPGTYNNVGGGSTITVTEELNALVSNGTYWFVGVEIPIDAPPGNAVWGQIIGTLSNQTDLKNILDLKADLVAGKVPSSQLPSYVDDVVEVADFAALPVSGETGKIYVTLDSGFIYRWTGTIYVRIADEAPTWGAIVGTLSDQTDLQSALNAKVPTSRTITINGTTYDLSANRSWSITEGVWGQITGTLSNQTDLQSALDGKFDDPTGDTTQYIAGDGSLISFPVAGQAGTLVRSVLNNSGSTITKGTVVYINGASGNKPTIAKALATSDSTSAQTFGLVQADISNNANGYVVCIGDLIGVNTSGISVGTQLYLSSTTAGEYTTTKQLAPAHLVYVGVVTRSHASLGQIEVKIQNGYELDELHDVAISSKTNKDFLTYESSSDLWKNKSLGTILGGTSLQFVKGDGSLDSTTYAVDSGLVHITGTETITGTKTFTQAVKAASFQLSGGTGNSLYYGHTNKLVVANYEVGGGIDFETNGGTINMTLNEFGNLGIGTLNPSSKLTIGRDDSSSEGGQIDFCRASDNATAWGIEVYGSTSTPSLRFNNHIAVTTPMTINSSGNVGIGVDPSAWDTAWKVLQLSYGSLYSSIYSNIMSHNLYVPGEDTKYISSNLASQYEQNSGAHWWSTAPTGTAGANMTLTTRMVLTNDGKLGIGTEGASPSGILHLKGAFAYPSFGNNMLNIEDSADNYSGIVFSGTSGANAAIRSEGANTLTFWTGAFNKRMTITSGGNVGIGTANATGQSSDNRALQIYGAGFANRAQIHFVNSNTGEGTSDGTFIGIDSGKDFYLNNTEGATIFENSGSERMRIFSSGNVYIGSSPSDSGAKLNVGGRANINGTTITSSYGGTGSVTTEFAIPGSLGGLFIARGFNVSNGVSFSVVYNVVVRVPGGGGQDVYAILISQNGVSTTFTFDNNGGYLRINPSANISWSGSFMITGL